MYTPAEIEKAQLPSENQLLNEVMNDIYSRALANDPKKPIAEYEIDLFGQWIHIGKLVSGNSIGTWDDFACLAGYKFRFLYLVYYDDVSGESTYLKPKGEVYAIVNPIEVKQDIKYLAKEAEDWKVIVDQERQHSDPLLNQVAIETRNELKLFEETRPPLHDQQKLKQYKYLKRRLYLHSKYIYLMAKGVFESFDKKDFTFSLNGQEIVINEYSIIHILNRHFAQLVKPHSDKSFHNMNIAPRYLNKDIKSIMEKIDNSGLYIGHPIRNINFVYKGDKYALWTERKTIQVKGQGNVQINRLQSFYPIEEQDTISRLNTEFVLKKVDDDISVYVPKVA